MLERIPEKLLTHLMKETVLFSLSRSRICFSWMFFRPTMRKSLGEFSMIFLMMLYWTNLVCSLLLAQRTSSWAGQQKNFHSRM